MTTMDSGMYDDLAVEELVKQHFGMRIEIKQTLVRGAPVSHTSEATVFLSTKNQLYVLVSGQSRMKMGDVKKIIARMGLKAELFIPPKGQPDYFNKIAKEHFHKVFPGRTHISSDDLAYYQTLAIYQPALVQISEVSSGKIYQFDTDSASSWRPVTEFSYRRIRTS
jgi:hypothetical protein